MNISFSSWDTR